MSNLLELGSILLNLLDFEEISSREIREDVRYRKYEEINRINNQKLIKIKDSR